MNQIFRYYIQAGNRKLHFEPALSSESFYTFIFNIRLPRIRNLSIFTSLLMQKVCVMQKETYISCKRIVWAKMCSLWRVILSFQSEEIRRSLRWLPHQILIIFLGSLNSTCIEKAENLGGNLTQNCRLAWTVYDGVFFHAWFDSTLYFFRIIIFWLWRTDSHMNQEI